MAVPVRGADVRGLSDLDLIPLVVDRDADASAELFRRHRSAMFAHACRISSDTLLADDATQDACLQAWQDAARYDRTRGSVLSWLKAIVRGRTLDRLRARQLRDDRIRPGFDTDTAGSGPCAVEHAIDVRAGMRRVDAVLDLLPEPEGRAIRLAYHEGLTHTEIATRLSVPLGTAKTQLRRGMQMLRSAVYDRPRRPFQFGDPVRRIRSGGSFLTDVNVLIVDDEPDTVRLTALILKRAGASVVCARSAAEAAARLETVWPDVALIDLGMPDADGFAVLAQIRGIRIRHRRRCLPAVAFTAMASPRDRDETRVAGFALHLAKPIGPARLVDAVASVVHASASQP